MVDKLQVDVLKGNARAITAMRRAYNEHRFGLILGAGVSRAFDFKVPTWKELLDRLSKHPDVDGERVDALDGTPSSRADVLFRHFRWRVRQEFASKGDSDEYVVDRIVRGEWRALIREILYESAPQPERLRERHPYLSELLGIVLKSPLTITYNFDGYLEMMLATLPISDQRGRAYETVFDGSKPFRSTIGVIYHPNGYLPQSVLDRASEELVFSEEQFGDQLLASMAGHYSSLAHHLSKNNCLFVGLSLTDENLRHLLRHNAVHNPGHFHYFVHWVDHKDPITDERAEALADYRFNVYNLITLFLKDEEINALGKLIQLSYNDFKAISDAAGVPTKYVFYLTGIPGIGKTTLLRHLASLSVYDEWLSDPLPLMAKPHSELTAEEKARVDDWIAKQMRTKNESLLGEHEGIFVVERGPLDPISFEDISKLKDKAVWYKSRVLPTSYDVLCDGSVLLLWGDPDKVSLRIASRQTIQQPANYLGKLQDRLRSVVYTDPSIHQLHSTDWSINQLVRAVVDVIHWQDYQPVPLLNQLKALTDKPA